MLDLFVFETTQLIEQLETFILSSEKSSCYTPDAINEIFRIMHTIKGSAAMMMFDNISSLAHAIEDLFHYLREEKPQNVDCSALSDLMFESVDFIKVEIEKIKNGDDADGEVSTLIDNTKAFLSELKRKNQSSAGPEAKKRNSTRKQEDYKRPERAEAPAPENSFKAVIHFEDDCGMESVRAFSIIHDLKGIAGEVFCVPETDDDDSTEIIRRDGFKVYLRADCSYEKLYEFLMQTPFLKDLELVQLDSDEFSGARQTTDNNVSKAQSGNKRDAEDRGLDSRDIQTASMQHSFISVSVSKLDKLMDLVGEMVIAEAMVVQNPDLKGLELNNFQKAARQLHKITGEIQDMVMSIRMVPVAATFHKMHRVARDMCKKLGKDVELKLIGEETEMDKNIIEHISDPLMHLIRNAIDHGIEPPEDRQAIGKPQTGTVTLEARSSGSDVLIIVRDDGRGLNREKILQRAKEKGLLERPESEMSDKEVYNLIFFPGFSTKDDISEFSGRGVGMDVVAKNIEAVGGSVSIESIEGEGSAVTLKIPLTLAIIDGMNIKVGNSRYTIPTISIKESFRPKDSDIIKDTDNNEMIMVRGQCYPILRLHEYYGVMTDVTDLTQGILVMAEAKDKFVCIFADELLGQQQVVVKTLPNYIRNTRKIRGLTGCTLLGDGSISLILDVSELV